jgi:Uma2 family endonuclease
MPAMTNHRPDVSAAPPIVIRDDVTADMYFGMGASSQPQDLIDGLLYLSPPPGDLHDDRVAALSGALRAYARTNGGHVIRPRFDCWFDETNVVQPDGGYLAPDRVSLAGRYIHGAPDLLIEVFSPGSREFDNEAKFGLYGRVGVREAWFVDPGACTTTVVTGEGGAWVREQTVPFGTPIPSQVVDVGSGGLEAASAR